MINLNIFDYQNYKYYLKYYLFKIIQIRYKCTTSCTIPVYNKGKLC